MVQYREQKYRLQKRGNAYPRKDIPKSQEGKTLGDIVVVTLRGGNITA